MAAFVQKEEGESKKEANEGNHPSEVAYFLVLIGVIEGNR